MIVLTNINGLVAMVPVAISKAIKTVFKYF